MANLSVHGGSIHYRYSTVKLHRCFTLSHITIISSYHAMYDHEDDVVVIYHFYQMHLTHRFARLRQR